VLPWVSRPPGDIARIFGGRHFAILGVSPGGFGTLLAQNDWLPVLRALGANLFKPAARCSFRARRTYSLRMARSAALLSATNSRDF